MTTACARCNTLTDPPVIRDGKNRAYCSVACYNDLHFQEIHTRRNPNREADKPRFTFAPKEMFR